LLQLVPTHQLQGSCVINGLCQPLEVQHNSVRPTIHNFLEVDG
jgi:hypothetical protein